METISQRQLRNDSGEILRRAAAGERFLIRSGEVFVELRRASPTVVEQLASSGRLSPASSDDFSDFPLPTAGREPVDMTLTDLRGDR